MKTNDTNQKSELSRKEEEILKFWQENDIFAKTLKKPAPQGEFIFYEGPPTANARPALHHLEARVFKDVIPRYKTMRGYHVRRKAGWDTHGLPVELEVEKELGFKSKRDIERLGVAAFNRKCRENVWKYIDEWERFTDRIGFWLDQKDAYSTYRPEYIESLWHIIKQVQERGLLYQDYKVVPWCPRCGTALSSHELAQGYEDVEDLAVTVKFKVKGEENTYLLTWTTTPWTLPGNVALAVGNDFLYFEYKEVGGNTTYILAKDRVASFFDADGGRIYKRVSYRGKEYSYNGEYRGSRLIEKFKQGYEPPYPYFINNLPEDQKGKLSSSFKIYPADFVTTEEGTGIVHTAVMYGVDDFELGQKIGLLKHHLVAEDGTFTTETPWAGKFVKDADKDIIADLQRRGLLFGNPETVTHTYPFCWRCQTPLLYYARDSWYIKMSALRDELIKENQKIHWEPEHIRDGRFGEWLKEVKDWAISRERYWGTPLPIWQSVDGRETAVIGSLEELKRYTKKSGNRYFVMRHGEAENNTKNILSSRADNPHHLTTKGREQVKAAIEKLKRLGIDLIVSSDFIRGRETAALVARGLGLVPEQTIYDPRLGEVNHGDLNLKSIEEYYGYYQTFEERFSKALPSGEDFSQIRRRLGECLYELEKKYHGKTILIISHESPIWLLCAIASGLDLEKTVSLRDGKQFFFQNAEWQPLAFVPLPHNDDFELDLHRPALDNLELVSDSGEKLMRVPEVLDVWFDSGAMPFAQDHYPFDFAQGKPFSGQELLYPADYIAEAIDQTRGWFYTLLAIAVLMGRGTPYRNVICLGHVLDKDGKKMSKSLGNVVDPWTMMAKYGADALRFWMYIVNQPGDSKNFAEATVIKAVNKVFNPLFNVLKFYELYAGGELKQSAASEHILDRWVLALLNKLTKDVTLWLDNYKITEPARALRDFIIDLSQWYVRRSRERFKNEKEKKFAAATLRYVLCELSKLLAPFAPFAAEAVYQRTKAADDPESVHLADWPTLQGTDERLVAAMAEVRRLVSLGLEERMRLGIKVRQPLPSVKLKAKSEKLTPDLVALIRDELNVKEVIFDEAMPEAVQLDIRLTPELEEEGQLRELTRELQGWRKRAGLVPGQRVPISVPRSQEALVRKFERRLKQLVGASEFIFTDI